MIRSNIIQNNQPKSKLKISKERTQKLYKKTKIWPSTTQYTNHFKDTDNRTNLTHASPTTPMAIPAESPARPQARPEERRA